jgi:hypothetical protein
MVGFSSSTNGHHRAGDLFRLGHLTDEPHEADDQRRGKTVTGLLDSTTDNRALVVALGLILAAHEDTWTTDTWRRPSPADARYLMFPLGTSPACSGTAARR